MEFYNKSIEKLQERICNEYDFTLRTISLGSGILWKVAKNEYFRKIN